MVVGRRCCYLLLGGGCGEGEGADPPSMRLLLAVVTARSGEKGVGFLDEWSCCLGVALKCAKLYIVVVLLISPQIKLSNVHLFPKNFTYI